MNNNRCVSCGNIIPEGRMTCPRCERTSRINYYKSYPKFLKEVMGIELTRYQLLLIKLYDIALKLKSRKVKGVNHYDNISR